MPLQSTALAPRSAGTPRAGRPALATMLLALVTALVAACGSGTAAGADTMPAQVNVDEAAALRDDGAFVLDVRQPEEWLEIHIPDATLIPLGELAARVAEVPKDQEILVYCRSGNRSQEGRDILKAAGFENVTSMAGGIKDWAAAGYETVSGP
jgi:phage shock protein E